MGDLTNREANKKIEIVAPVNINRELNENKNIVAPIPDPLQINAQPIQQGIEKMNGELLPQVDIAQVDAKLKRYKSIRTVKQINADTKIRMAKREQKDYMGSQEQMIDNAEILKNESEILMKDKKWYSLFNKESKEMTNVKQSLAYLTNLLDAEVQTDANKNLDINYILKTIIPAYQTAFDMCDVYLETHKNKAKYSTGKRRKNQVMKVMRLLRSELDDMKLVLDNAYAGIDITKIKSVRALLGEVRAKKAAVSRFMPEGNSSNVYRIRVMGEDGKYYYVKKDEKLLHENMDIYVGNRIVELKRSRDIRKNTDKLSPAGYDKTIADQEAKIAEIDEKVRNKQMTEEEGDREIIKIRAGREELRLEGKIDMADYDDAISFLEEIQKNITGNKSKEKQAAYKALFAHDFDKFFKEMQEYNANIEKLHGDAEQIDRLIETITKGQKLGWEKQVAELNKAKEAGNLTTKNELQWFKDHLEMFGITEADDGDLMKIIENMGKRKNGLSRLFTRSLGKEAELFGQHAERSGLSSSDILAANNTATSRLAKLFKFDDVVTRSFKGKLEFTEVGKTETTVANVTFSEEAPGEELLQIMIDAKKEGAKVKYSPNAIRQMSRMHTFDLITLQTDRHWRNIKAQITKNGKEWVIESMKCYDHDQSFGNKTLTQYFADVKDEATGEIHTKREGFLTPIMMTVSKSSNLYKYVKKTKLTDRTGKSGIRDSGNFMDNIQLPKSKHISLDKATENYKKSHDGHDQYTVNPWQVINRAYTTFNSFGNQERENELTNAVLKENEGKEQIVREFFQKFSKLASAIIDTNMSGLTDELLTDKENDAESVEKVINKRIEEYKAKAPSGYMFSQEKIDEEAERLRETYMSSVISRKEMFRLYKEVYALYQQIDLTGLEKGLNKYGYPALTGGDNVEGFYDYNIQGFLYQIKMEFQTGDSSDGVPPEKLESWKKNKQAMEEVEKEDRENQEKEIRKKIKAEKPNLSDNDLDNEVQTEMARLNGEVIRMPAVLHMDREAFDQVVAAYNDPQKLEYMLVDLNMTIDKKDALKERLKEIIDQAHEAEKAVKEWADMAGIKEDDIRRKFFLEEGDYEKIDSLTDMATDPGMSYFSVEDSQFLAGEKDMQLTMSAEDKMKAKKITNEERNTQRQRQGDLTGEYEPMVSNSIYKPQKEQAA